MTYERIEQYLEARGYALAGLTVDEVEALAMAEGFTYNERTGTYRYVA